MASYKLFYTSSNCLPDPFRFEVGQKVVVTPPPTITLTQKAMRFMGTEHVIEDRKRDNVTRNMYLIKGVWWNETLLSEPLEIKDITEQDVINVLENEK